MDASIQVIQAQAAEVEHAAKMIKGSIRTFVGALQQYLDLISECGNHEIPVSALESFGHTLTLAGEDLTEAGNHALSRLAAAQDAAQPIPPYAHHPAEPPTEAPGSSPS